MTLSPNIPSFINASSLIERAAERQEELHGFAHVIFDRLMQQIKVFEESLAPDEEVAAYLSSFGARILVQIDHIGYHNPYLIILSGKNVDTQDQVQLVQHCTQLNVLFTALKVQPEEGRKPRRIGFVAMEQERS